MKGYAGRILRANLSNGSSRTDTLPAEWPRRLLGGMGFASMLLFNETSKGLNALGGDNKLIVAPRLLTGTGIPTASSRKKSSKECWTITIKPEDGHGVECPRRPSSLHST
jgi:aldehyde:ferredoxin oxidoreductase